MSEFAPICLCFVLSLLVSVILLSVTFLLNSNSSIYPLFQRRGIPFLCLASIVFVFYLIGGVSLLESLFELDRHFHFGIFSI
jgi:TctA family transporter